ncbi:MAG: hypothetical protein J6S67_07580 [Methanobrevibacter sp.]|nr:hypothetical protein [Methanobrevibacter sp.]
MNQELLNVIITGLGVIVTGLCSWATTALINFLNAKIADRKLATFLTQIGVIVSDAVQSIYQEFVETLKEQGKFDVEAQQEAKRRAMAIINSQLTNDMKQYIEDNFGNVELWISEKIESVIYQLKKKKKLEER